MHRLKSAVKIGMILTALCSACGAADSGKLAIVIDDIGYQQQEDAAIFAMPKEIAVAIIPAAPHARQANRRAKEQGRDILIHMPMQPLNGQRIEEGGLHVGMTADEVARRIQTAKEIVPDAIGMNNHMGSAATSDQRLMTYLMTELRKHRLSFLDSRTIGRSVAYKTAQTQGVKALERHIFLDNSNIYEDVRTQFQKALHYARKHGTAVVIGHPRHNTIAVLQQELRRLPQDIQLVGIGSLWSAEPTGAPSFIYPFDSHAAPTSVPPYRFVPLLRGIPQ